MSEATRANGSHPTPLEQATIEAAAVLGCMATNGAALARQLAEDHRALGHTDQANAFDHIAAWLTKVSGPAVEQWNQGGERGLRVTKDALFQLALTLARPTR